MTGTSPHGLPARAAPAGSRQPESESREVARAALLMALTRDHGEEAELQARLSTRQGIYATAVDCGGPFGSIVGQVVERAVVAAKRERVIRPVHAEEGAVAGAAHEAVTAVAAKGLGLNVGGKVGVARRGEHVVVVVFCSVGLVHLDDVAVGIGHRALPAWQPERGDG